MKHFKSSVASKKTQPDVNRAVKPVVEQLERRVLFSISFSFSAIPASSIDEIQDGWTANTNSKHKAAEFDIAVLENSTTLTGDVSGKSSATDPNDFIVGLQDALQLHAQVSGNDWCDPVSARFFNWSVMDSPSGKCPGLGESEHPVRYADGAAKMIFDDFDGLTATQLGGLQRSWSNLSYSGDQVGAKLAGFGIDSQPWVQNLYTQNFAAGIGYSFLGVVFGSNQAFVALNWGSDPEDSKAFTNLVGTGEIRIWPDSVNHTYNLLKPDGTRLVFADFSGSWDAKQKGTLIKEIDPNGVSTTVTDWTADFLPSTIETTYPAVGTAPAVVEQMAYTYSTSGDQITHATLSRGDGTTMTPVRTVDYSYYDGTTTGGNAGNLKSVTIRVTLHPSATVSAGSGGNLPVLSSVRNAAAMVLVGSWPRRCSVR